MNLELDNNTYIYYYIEIFNYAYILLYIPIILYIINFCKEIMIFYFFFF